MGIFENGQNLLGNLKSSAVAESVRKFAPFVLAGTVGYAAADLTVLSVRDSLLPTSVPQTRNRSLVGGKKANIGTYSKIRTQNIFNADGEIPPPLSADESQDNAAPTNEAVLSQLPLTLQGTIVHFNPERSIATVRLNRKNSTQSFIPGEEIEGMAKVLTVERRKVIFTNLNTGIKEYIEIPEKAAFDFSVQAKSNPQPKGPVEEKGRNNFTVKRTEVDRLTKNLSQVLQQARMEPRFGPDNSVNGFCFVSIQSGSIYETLGFRNTDCISKVNGEDVTSPQQAMELFQKLKTSSNIQLGVDRDGRSETFNYDIN